MGEKKNLNNKKIGLVICFMLVVVSLIPNSIGIFNKTYAYFNNEPPVKPYIPSGPSKGITNVLYGYSSISLDDELFYMWDWGDETSSSWIEPLNNEEIIKEEHSWIKIGEYEVKLKAKDKWGQESKWSDPLIVRISKEKKSIISIYFELIEKFPILYPIIKRLNKIINKDFEINDGTEYWGLLIAVGEYLNHSEQNRPTMLIEIEHLYDVLIDSRNWQSSHIRKIKGENATLENIINGLKLLFQRTLRVK